jgi:hypothetical protein
MKKLIAISFWAIVCLGYLYMMNCSKPLDSVNHTQLANADSLYVADTIIVGDTIIVVDTMYCGRLNAQRQEIVWMLFNQEGLYQLEFAAISERLNDTRTLVIDINDQEFYWMLEDNLEFIIEQNLNENT